MGTTNTFTSLQPNMKDQYSDGKPKFKKIKEKVKKCKCDDKCACKKK